MPERVLIFDTTLRDGEQSPGATMNDNDKIEVARHLARMGVDVMEAGFPIASPGDLAAVRRIAKEVKGCVIAGLARTSNADIDAAWEAVQYAENPRIHTFVSTSPIHIERKLQKSPDDVIEMARQAVRRCKGYVADVEFSAEDATRSDWDYLCKIFAVAIEEGATTINIPDTVGYTMPGEYVQLIEYIRENTPGIEDVIISVHCHDDLGMATANTLAAIRAGARQAEVTINGIGERAGNTSLEEVVMALRTRQDLYPGLDTRIDTAQLVPASKLITRTTGIQVQPNKAIVGSNAFSHEAGIHQDGMLKDRETYEIMTPQSVGWDESKLVMGKHSGRAGFNAKLNELGYQVDPETLKALYSRFIDLTDRKKTISDADIIAIVEDSFRQVDDMPIKLIDWRAASGADDVCEAAVMLEIFGKEQEATGRGNGQVDALYTAVNALVDFEPVLEHLHVEAITSSADAQGSTTVRVLVGEELYTGRSVSTDIIAASLRAYILALNRAMVDRQSESRIRAKEAV